MLYKKMWQSMSATLDRSGMPEEMNGANGGPDGKTFIPPMSGFKGEA